VAGVVYRPVLYKGSTTVEVAVKERPKGGLVRNFAGVTAEFPGG
jgi:hypothetical protein